MFVQRWKLTVEGTIAYETVVCDNTNKATSFMYHPNYAFQLDWLTIVHYASSCDSNLLMNGDLEGSSLMLLELVLYFCSTDFKSRHLFLVKCSIFCSKSAFTSEFVVHLLCAIFNGWIFGRIQEHSSNFKCKFYLFNKVKQTLWLDFFQTVFSLSKE